MPDHDDYWDWPSPSDPAGEPTDDELAEDIERAHWALEVQGEVALMNARIRY